MATIPIDESRRAAELQRQETDLLERRVQQCCAEVVGQCRVVALADGWRRCAHVVCEGLLTPPMVHAGIVRCSTCLADADATSVRSDEQEALVTIATAAVDKFVNSDEYRKLRDDDQDTLPFQWCAVLRSSVTSGVYERWSEISAFQESSHMRELARRQLGGALQGNPFAVLPEVILCAGPVNRSQQDQVPVPRGSATKNRKEGKMHGRVQTNLDQGGNEDTQGGLPRTYRTRGERPQKQAPPRRLKKSLAALWLVLFVLAASVSLLSPYCGIDSMADSLKVMGDEMGVPVHVVGWADSDDVAQDVQHHKHPGAQFRTDCRGLIQDPFKFEDGVNPDILAAGFPCQPVAGCSDKLGARHPQADGGKVTFQIAHAHGVPVVCAENVTRMVSDDEQHGLHTQLQQQAHEVGFKLQRLQMLTHTQCGGSTARRRAFWTYVREDALRGMPRWLQAVEPYEWHQGTPVREHIMDAESVPEHMWYAESLDQAGKQPADTAIPQFIMRWGGEGEGSEPRKGHMVEVRGSKQRWRVMDRLPEGRLLLMNAVRARSRGSMHTRHEDEVQRIVREEKEVFSVDGVIPSLTAKGEPPDRPGCLIAQWVDGEWRARNLTAVEAWRAQQCSEDTLQFLLDRGYSESDLFARLGNSIPMSMCTAASKDLLEWVVLYKMRAALVEEWRVPLTVADPVVTDKCRQLNVTVVLSQEEPMRVWLAAAGQLTLGEEADDASDHNSTTDTASRWVRSLASLDEAPIALTVAKGKTGMVQHNVIMVRVPEDSMPDGQQLLDDDRSDWPDHAKHFADKIVNMPRLPCGWFTPEEILDQAMRQCVVMAMMRVRRSQQPMVLDPVYNTQGTDAPLRHLRTGILHPKKAEANLVLTTVVNNSEEATAEKLRRVTLDTMRLKQGLQDAQVEPRLKTWMNQGADAVQLMDIAHAPPDLLVTQHVLTDDTLGNTPWSSPKDHTGASLPRQTKWIRHKAPPPLLKDYRPTCFRDGLNEHGLQQYTDYRCRLITAMKECRNLPVLVMGRECFTEQALAAGLLVFDKGMPARRIDLSRRGKHKFNTDYLERVLKYYPDQETLGHMVQGVSFKLFDIGQHFILQPNLKKMAERAEELRQEHVKFAKHDPPWFEAYDDPMFSWGRNNCLSFEEKADGSLRPLQDMGSPRGASHLVHFGEQVLKWAVTGTKLRDDIQYFRLEGQHTGSPWKTMQQWEIALEVKLVAVTLDAQGDVVLSVNQAAGVVKRIDRRRGLEAAAADKWEEEVKVTAQEISEDVAIMHGIAEVQGTVPVAISVDAKKYFLQFALLEDVQPFMQVVTLNEAGDDLVFWRQYVMPMGASPSSSVAQRCLDALLFVLIQQFKVGDAPFVEQQRQSSARFDAIFSSREQLSDVTGRTQDVLAAARGYTDDAAILLPDIDRAQRMYALIHDVLGPGGANVELSQEKLVISPALHMVGVTWLLPFAAVVTTMDKRTKAVEKLQQAVDGTIMWSEYRKLIGLLWFILSVVNLDAHAMNNMSLPLRGAHGAAGVKNPNKLILEDRPFLLQRWTSWITWLLQVVGTHCVSALGAEVQVVACTQAEMYHLSSDACGGDDSPNGYSGAGGWMNGKWWRYQFTGLAAELHVTHKETLARLGNAMTVLCNVPTGAPNINEMDASTTVAVANTGRAKSVVLGEIGSVMHQQPDFVRTRPYATEDHIYGPINELSDAASRNDVVRLRKLAAMMGITPVEVFPPKEFHEVVMRMAQLWKQLKEQEQRAAVDIPMAEQHCTTRVQREHPVLEQTEIRASKRQKAWLYTADELAHMRGTDRSAEQGDRYTHMNRALRPDSSSDDAAPVCRDKTQPIHSASAPCQEPPALCTDGDGGEDELARPMTLAVTDGMVPEAVTAGMPISLLPDSDSQDAATLAPRRTTGRKVKRSPQQWSKMADKHHTRLGRAELEAQSSQVKLKGSVRGDLRGTFVGSMTMESHEVMDHLSKLWTTDHIFQVC